MSNSRNPPVTVICSYRVKEGCQDEFKALLAKHCPTLRELGLATEREPTFFVGDDQGRGPHFVEIFEWRDEEAAGRDFGFEEAGCGGANSIHFQIAASAIACRDETTLNACAWGCGMAGCNPDPCDSVTCPAFCMDGVCLDDNPCDDVTCTHGCVRGRCLQNRHARGPDGDDDGFSYLADCDDADPEVHPGQPEVCGDGKDNDCDGDFDEADCAGESGEVDAGPAGGADGAAGSMDGGVGGGPEDGGCGCRVGQARSGPAWALLLLGLPWLRRRRVGRG